MKWISIYAVVLTLPLHAMLNQGLPQNYETERERQILKKEKNPQPPPFDADLFRKNEEILSATLEFLYWSVAEGDLDYALKMRHAAWSAASSSYAQGRYESARYEIDPGFRVSLLFFRAPHYWEVKWQYTRLTADANNSVNAPADTARFLTGTWPQVSPNPLSKARSHIHLNYNVFDMSVDRVFIPNPHLRMRVIAGLISAWIDQDWIVHYTDSVSNITKINNRWNFVGAGIKAGSAGDWYWSGNLYLTGLGSFNLLMGRYSNHSKQFTTYQPSPSDNISIPIRDTSFHDVRPVMDVQMMIGPSWQKDFPKNRVELFAGFEMNFWFNLQEIYRSTAGAPSQAKESWINSSLLSTYGLTTRITVDF